MKQRVPNLVYDHVYCDDDPSLPVAFRIASAFACSIEDVFQPNTE